MTNKTVAGLDAAALEAAHEAYDAAPHREHREALYDAITAYLSALPHAGKVNEALNNACDLLDFYISTFGDYTGAHQASVNDYRDALSSQHVDAVQVATALCSDCPPIGYLPDETRCAPCPRRSALIPTTSPAKGGAEVEALREAGQAFANQVRYVTCLLPGDDYAKTVEALASFDAALRTSAPVGQQAKEGE